MCIDIHFSNDSFGTFLLTLQRNPNVDGKHPQSKETSKLKKGPRGF